METFKKYGSLILGAIFQYDFIITFLSTTAEPFDVLGLEVSKINYLAYLQAIAISFLSYGFTKQFQSDEKSAETKDIVQRD